MLRRSCGRFFPLHLYKSVDSQAFRLWARLQEYRDMNGGEAFPSQVRLAEEFGTTRRAVARAVRELKDKGWLTVRREERQPAVWFTIYELCVPEDESKTESKTTPPRSRKRLHMESKTSEMEVVTINTTKVGEAAGAALPLESKRKRATREAQLQALKATPRPIHSDPYVQMSVHLAEAVRVRYGIDTPKPAAVGRAAWFRKLTKLKAIPVERIQSAMSWWCAALKDGRWDKPYVDCPSRFYMMFGAIEDRMRGERGPVDRFPAPAEKTLRALSVEGRSLYRDLVNFKQPVKETAILHLLAVVQEWAQRLLVSKVHSAGDRERYSWRRLLAPAGVGFGAAFAAWVRRRVDGWDHWSGKLDGFYPGGKHFMAFVSECGRAAEWTPVMQKAVEKACEGGQ